MSPRISVLGVFALSLVLASFGDMSKPSLRFVDSYLANMDQYVQGGGSLSRINDEAEKFHAALAVALESKDKRAPGRLVFFAVIHDNGLIPYETDLGRACEILFAGDVPLSSYGDSVHKCYSVADVYAWWERHKSEYEAFPPYDAWKKREYVKRVMIPKYESLAKK